MASRIWSRWSKTLLYVKHIRSKVTVPNELPRRPMYVPTHGFLLLSIPLSFTAATIYYEAAEQDLNLHMRNEAFNSTLDLVELPVK